MFSRAALKNCTKRLYSRMRDEKLRVWFAPEDIKGGQKIHEQLEQAIQVHDRLLIVLSEQSMQSEGVMTEIRNARQAEIRESLLLLHGLHHNPPNLGSLVVTTPIALMILAYSPNAGSSSTAPSV
jgi:hypothetical protein